MGLHEAPSPAPVRTRTRHGKRRVLNPFDVALTALTALLVVVALVVYFVAT